MESKQSKETREQEVIQISDRGDAGVDGPDADVKAVDRRGDGEEQCEERYCQIQLRWRVRSPSGHSEMNTREGMEREEALSETLSEVSAGFGFCWEMGSDMGESRDAKAVCCSFVRFVS